MRKHWRLISGSLVTLLFVYSWLYVDADLRTDGAQPPKVAAYNLTTVEVPPASDSDSPTVEPHAAPVETDRFSEAVSSDGAPADIADLWHRETVASGDNLSLIFARAGFSDRDVYRVTQADGGRALKKIFPGESIDFLTASNGELQAIRHIESPLKTTVFERLGDHFNTNIILREPDIVERAVSLTIDTSLFEAGQAAGLSSAVIMDLAGIFGGVIDFVLDPRRGDQIVLIYQEQLLDGDKFDDGAIIAAAFTNQGTTYQAFRFTDSEGYTAYYNEAGTSMRKAFLRAPLDFTRVSSNFNPNRLHPVSGTRRPHRGTDYAAPRGTPVFAAGDGRVSEAGYTRANGNYVFIDHGETFKTHYLHLHRLAVTQGTRVKQGQVIGTVGSTGLATGPHLHYEFLVNGVHRNPRTVHSLLPKAKTLPEAELVRFQETIDAPMQRLAVLFDPQQVAVNP